MKNQWRCVASPSLCVLTVIGGCHNHRTTDNGDTQEEMQGDAGDVTYEDFAEAADVSTAIEITGPSPGDDPILVARDHIILVVAASLSAGEAMAAVAEVERAVGGVKVGQVPDYRLYQLRVAGDTQARLDDALEIARGITGIESAAYNVMAEYLAPLCLTMDDDAANLRSDNRKAFDAIEYFHTLAVWEEIEPMLSLGGVRVGLMDTGFSMEHGNFDDVPVRNGLSPGAPLTDPDGHGTQVGAIIATDNWDGCGSGIASRFLGDRLRMGIYAIGGIFDGFFACRRALVNGEQILNISIGYNTLGVRWFAEMWSNLMRDYPRALMVAAAPNRNEEINEQGNHAPGTVSGPNIITVGGIKTDDWSLRREDSSYGLAVEIGAPSDRLVADLGEGPLLEAPLPGCFVVAGNSFAAPQVTALAAILKSVNPSLSGADLKRAILYNAGPTLADFGKAAPSLFGLRLLLFKPLMQVLVDKEGTPAPVLALLDANTDGVADPKDTILKQLCANADYEVEGYSSLTFEGLAGEDLSYRAHFSPPMHGTHWDFSITMSASIFDTDSIEQLRIITAAEALSTVLDEAWDVATDESIYNITLPYGDDTVVDSGNWSEGTVTFTRCDIIDRGMILNPLLSERDQTMIPRTVLMEGFFGGTVDIWEISRCGGFCLAPEPHGVRGHFAIMTSLDGVLSDTTLINGFEYWCAGGFSHYLE